MRVCVSSFLNNHIKKDISLASYLPSEKVNFNEPVGICE